MMHDRYSDPMITGVWSPEETLRRWLEVEALHMGVVASDVAADELRRVTPPSPGAVAGYERQTRHEVTAFLYALDDRIRMSVELPAERRALLRAKLHLGLTSSDLVDTAFGMAMRASHAHLHRLLWFLCSALEARCIEWSQLGSTWGRTHGQRAIPMPAVHRWDVLSSMLSRARLRFHEAGASVAVGKLSGPVGVNPDADGDVLREVGLHSLESSQLVPRDNLAHWAHCAAGVATVCEAIATQVWLLAQQEIGEATEWFGEGQTGSSAMPHKRNPISCENIRGMARLVRAYADALQASPVQWGEHDLSHSSVERVAVPDLCHSLAAVLTRTHRLIDGVSLSDPRVPLDYDNSHEQLVRAQLDGEPYAVAHRRLTGTYQRGNIPAPIERTSE